MSRKVECKHMSMLEEFKNSNFYKKYENEYFSAIVLKRVFGVNEKVPRFYKKIMCLLIKKCLK